MGHFIAMQDELKQRIKAWLKAQGQSREWLSERCGVAPKTVNNWLSSPRDIPAKAVLIIERLMDATSTPAEEADEVPDSVLVLKVNEPRFDAYSQASLSEGLPLREWAIHALDLAAGIDQTGSSDAPNPVDSPLSPDPESGSDNTEASPPSNPDDQGSNGNAA